MKAGRDRVLRPRGTTIRTRMTLSMLCAAALVIPVVVLSWFYIRRMNAAVGGIVDRDIELMQVADRLSRAFAEARRDEQSFLLRCDSTYLSQRDASLGEVDVQGRRGRSLEPALAPRFDSIMNYASDYRALSDSLVAAAARVAADITLPVTDQQALADSVRVLQIAFATQTDSVNAFAHRSVAGHREHARQLAAWGQRNIFAILLLVIIVLSWLIFTLPQRAVLPIKRIANALRRAEDGELDVRVSLRSPDELGQLAAQLNRTFARLREFDEKKVDRILQLERRFRLLIDDIAEGVILFDRTPAILLANAALEPLLGCRASEAVGRPLRDYRRLLPLREQLEHVLASHTSDQACEVIAGLAGSAVCFEALRDRSGQIIGALVVLPNPAAAAAAEETDGGELAPAPLPPDCRGR